MHSKLIVPALVVALVAWRIYIRTRRSFGRQRIQPRRMAVRVGILGLVGIALLGVSIQDPGLLGGTLGGAACGALLSLLALRHTQVAVTPEGRFYTPHTYIGLTVTVLFLGRLIYDLLLITHGPTPSAGADGAPAYPQSPLTLAISGAFISYYISYYLGVLRRSRVPLAAVAVMPSDPQ